MSNSTTVYAQPTSGIGSGSAMLYDTYSKQAGYTPTNGTALYGGNANKVGGHISGSSGLGMGGSPPMNSKSSSVIKPMGISGMGISSSIPKSGVTGSGGVGGGGYSSLPPSYTPASPPSNMGPNVSSSGSKAIAAKFAKKIGQTIPDTWRSGVHYHLLEMNNFIVGEIVVVARSNGTKTFGKVEKVNNGTIDVLVAEQGETGGASYHRGVPNKSYGKIVDNVTSLTMLRGVEGVEFTEASAEVINRAVGIAISRGHSECGVVHVASAMLADKSGLVSQILKSSGGDPAKGINALITILNTIPKSAQQSSGQVPASPSLRRVFTQAQTASIQKGDSLIAVDQLLLAVMADMEVSACLSIADITPTGLKTAVEKGREVAPSRFTDKPEEAPEGLAQFSTDIVQQAMDGKLDPVVGRDEEISRVIRVLARRTKNNPVLIGEPGVGKTAIVEGLAQRIVARDVPQVIQGCRIMSLDMGALIAGAKFQGEFEERLKQVLKEVADSDGRIILFIDEIHLALGTGRSSDGAMDAANLLKPMLARGELRTIGATTLSEYRKYIEKDSAFERRFQQVYVGEASVDDSVSILRGIKDKYEQHHGVRILDSALVAAATLSHRYITGRFLPDKAIDLMDEACANIRVQLDSQPEIIDQLERKLVRLDIEATMLSKEEDEESRRRLQEVQAALAQTREEETTYRVRLQAQKERITRMNDIKRQIEGVREQIANLERPGIHKSRGGISERENLDKVVDLKYHDLPRLQAMYDNLVAQNDQEEHSLFTECVAPDQIAEVVSRWTGIPVCDNISMFAVQRLTQSEKEKLLDLADRLNQQVIGQEKSTQAIANAVIRARAGLGTDNRPTGCFMFLGPTGVGKTETARALARELFNDEKMLVRMDMSEYLEAHSVYRLIGAPPGYVGYDQGGQLTEAVRRRPYSVILCDEVEKAHPQVWNVLLQLMDDGRLTDGQGRVVDFKNTVVILTSNVGAEKLLDGMVHGQISKEVKHEVMGIVKHVFPPEFLNRIDEIALFSPLTEVKVAQILKIQLARYSKALEEKKIAVEMDDSAAGQLVRTAFNPAMGARPLKRLLERVVMTSLSRLVLKGVLDHGCKVRITADTGMLEYRVTNRNGYEQVFAEGQKRDAWGDED